MLIMFRLCLDLHGKKTGKEWPSFSSTSPPLGPCLQIFLPVKEGDERGERGSEEGKRAAGLGSVLELFLAKGKTDNRLPGHEAALMGHWKPGKS